ncbi:trehalose 2-sulfotransferase [Williamsia sterculiae]|nr:Stf0 family sulfotransferase [Williamsia sterculiae]
MDTRPRAYLVCASQRSGSTLLVESLRATGVAGEPAEFFQYLPTTSLAPQPREWFADLDDPSVHELLAPLVVGDPDSETADDWRVRVVASGRTPNGVWGGKLMWNQVPLLVGRAVALSDRTGTDLRSAVADLLGEEPLYVKVNRDEVVSQAVSFWRALQTQVWRGATPPELDANAVYHAGAIAYLVSLLRAQDAGWRAWFTESGVVPLEIDYRDLAADSAEQTGRVLAALGLDPELAPPPALERQANARSREWAERYRHDAETEGYPL